MKIAISSTGKNLDSFVDPRFGRADFLLIVDTDTGSITEIVDNLSAREAAHGAGINAASRIAEAGAEVLLTGRVGPKAAAVCEKAGIRMVNDASGTVQEAFNRFMTEQKGTTAQKTTREEILPDRLQSTGMGQGMGMGGGRGGGRGKGRGLCRR